MPTALCIQISKVRYEAKENLGGERSLQGQFQLSGEEREVSITSLSKLDMILLMHLFQMCTRIGCLPLQAVVHTFVQYNRFMSISLLLNVALLDNVRNHKTYAFI